MGELTLFMSSETDRWSSDLWAEIYEPQKKILETAFKRLPNIEKDTEIGFIPTIYKNLEGIKQRLYFNRKDHYIDFRPLINHDYFVNEPAHQRIRRLNSHFPTIKRKVHLLELPEDQKVEISKLCDSIGAGEFE